MTYWSSSHRAERLSSNHFIWIEYPSQSCSSAARKAMVFSSGGTVTFQVLAPIGLASSSGINSFSNEHEAIFAKGPCMVIPPVFKDHFCQTPSLLRRSYAPWHSEQASITNTESMRQREEFILSIFGDWSVLEQKTYYKYGWMRNPDVSQIPPSQFKMYFKAIGATSVLLFFVAQIMAEDCTSLSRLYSFASRQKKLTILFSNNSGTKKSVRSIIFGF
jgi:hypothetical protein